MTHPHADLTDRLLQQATMFLTRGSHSEAREAVSVAIQLLLALTPCDGNKLFEAGCLAVQCGAPLLVCQAFHPIVLAMEQQVPPTESTLVFLRERLGSALLETGRFTEASVQLKRVVRAVKWSLPYDHDRRLAGLSALGACYIELKQHKRAHSILIYVLSEFSTRLPQVDERMVAVRTNLATALHALGRYAEAQVHEKAILRALKRPRKGPVDPLLLRVRTNLAMTIQCLGQLERAKRYLQASVHRYSGRLNPKDPELLRAGKELADTLVLLQDIKLARIRVDLLATISALKKDHLTALPGVTRGCASDLRQRRSQLLDQVRSLSQSAHDAVRTLGPREAEHRCRRIDDGINEALSIILSVLAYDYEGKVATFLGGEQARSPRVQHGFLARFARDIPRLADQLRVLEALKNKLVSNALASSPLEFLETLQNEIDQRERTLLAFLSRAGGSIAAPAELTLSEIQACIPGDTALVTFRRFHSASPPPRPQSGLETQYAAEEEKSLYTSHERYLVYVLKHTGTLERVELGECSHQAGNCSSSVSIAVRNWQKNLFGLLEDDDGPGDLDACARHVRALVIDPILHLIDGVERLIVIPDGHIHMVPLDALPLDDVGANRRDRLVGDQFWIETRSTVFDLLVRPSKLKSAQRLLVVGNVDYSRSVRPVDRRWQWSPGFGQHRLTDAEARIVAELHEDHFGPQEWPGEFARGGQARPPILEADATRERLMALAPHARWLHVATHGWTGSAPLRSVWDSVPFPVHGFAAFAKARNDRVVSISPLLLCGIALSGANQPSHDPQQAKGLLTGEDISGLDLRACELAVLSACETNSGIVFSNQGIFSVQQAFHTAGVRSVLSSLWEVPDDITALLMLRFYSLVWNDGFNKAEALWMAKQAVRRTHPHPRGWAGWILTGDPN